MFWLDPATVPTWGDYLKEAGYKTYYKGKWHINQPDIIIPGTNNSLNSYDQKGFDKPEVVNNYLKANRLDNFGFSGWVGPEPHGSNPRNSGSSAGFGLPGRDIIYGDEAVDLINSLPDKPWALVTSFVNPHDIALYGEITKNLSIYNFKIDSSLPDIPPAPTANEDLSTKPTCQASYRSVYQEAFQPTIDSNEYRKLYYSLIKRVDQQILRVLRALDNSRFKSNTIVIFTSDHGDYLGAHGLFQKWYTAYEEAIHVPMMISVPNIKPGHRNMLTSHIDLAPTILGLLGLDTSKLQAKLKPRFTEIRDFVGRDLSPTIMLSKEMTDLPQYFMTDDNITKGLNEKVPPVVQPSSIETVIVRIKGCLYKYSRYFNNPYFAGQSTHGSPTPEEIKEALETPDEIEIYNLTIDPYEMNNLQNNSKLARKLRRILDEQRREKRLLPNNF